MNRVIPGGACHHVAMSVQDIEGAISFYKEAFGMRCLERWRFQGRPMCFLDMGDGVCLELHGGAQEASADGRLLHFCIHTSDIEAAYARAVTYGAEAWRPPFDAVIEGEPDALHVRVAWVRGFEGEPIELFQHMGKVLAP